MSHFGYDQGVFSGVLISKDFVKVFPETKNANISGITSSCFSVSHLQPPISNYLTELCLRQVPLLKLGAFFGCLASFIFGDRLGRKKACWLGLVLNVVGALLQIAAFSLPQMIVGRLINGAGMGITSSTCPVYMAETAPSRFRGKLVVLGSVAVTVGVCTASWINYALFGDNGPFQWRFPLGLQLVFPIIVLLVLPFVVESPRWLLLTDKYDEARLALAKLRGVKDLDDKYLADEIKSILITLQIEREDKTPWREVLAFKDETQNFRRLLLR